MRKLWLCLLVLACDDSTSGGAVEDARVVSAPDIAPIPIRFDKGPDAAPSRDAAVDEGVTPDAATPADEGLPEDTAVAPDAVVEVDAVIEVDAAPIEPCPAPRDGRLGVSITDLDGDPLLPNDRVRVEMELMTTSPDDTPLWLGMQNQGVVIDRETFRLDGAPVDLPEGDLTYLMLPLEAGIQPGMITYEAQVHEASELAVVLGMLHLTDDGRCPNPRSASGAFFQLLGRTGKTPVCVALKDFNSIQIAPHVERKNTSAYAEANGRREDLRADDFIFCPGAPTIVHSTEFCIQDTSDVTVSLAGSYKGDSGWEVDDFMLLEVLRAQQLLEAGTTTQHHTGGSTFWCGDPGVESLMCEQGCTAKLYDVESGEPVSTLEPVPESLGDPPRWQLDGEVVIDHLFPEDANRFELRATALDVGEQGTIQPALYLLIEAPN